MNPFLHGDFLSSSERQFPAMTNNATARGGIIDIKKINTTKK
jgi:hypothetical protein